MRSTFNISSKRIKFQISNFFKLKIKKIKFLLKTIYLYISKIYYHGIRLIIRGKKQCINNIQNFPFLSNTLITF